MSFPKLYFIVALHWHFTFNSVRINMSVKIGIYVHVKVSHILSFYAIVVKHDMKERIFWLCSDVLRSRYYGHYFSTISICCWCVHECFTSSSSVSAYKQLNPKKLLFPNKRSKNGRKQVEWHFLGLRSPLSLRTVVMNAHDISLG